MKTSMTVLKSISLLTLLVSVGGLSSAHADDTSSAPPVVNVPVAQTPVSPESREVRKERRHLKKDRKERSAAAKVVHQDNVQIKKDVQSGNLTAAQADETKRTQDVKVLRQERKQARLARKKLHREKVEASSGETKTVSQNQ